jgi:hypothetical protein
MAGEQESAVAGRGAGEDSETAAWERRQKKIGCRESTKVPLGRGESAPQEDEGVPCEAFFVTFRRTEEPAVVEWAAPMRKRARAVVGRLARCSPIRRGEKPGSDGVG